MTKLYNKPLFGLDLSTTAVKAVELRRRRRRYCLTSYAVEPLPPQAMTDQMVTDPDAVASAIARAHKRARIRRKHVATSVAGASVITKKVTIPVALKELEQQAQVWMEASHHLPGGIESMHLDYQTLGPDPKEEADQLTALLVACKREVIDGYRQAIEQAGLKASVIDVDPFAVENAYELGASPKALDRTVALLNVGTEITNINVLHQGQSLFTRDHYFGGQQLVESLSETYGWGYDQAEQRLMRGELPEEAEDQVVAPFLQSLASEVGRSLDFYATTYPEQTVEEAVLSGGGALLKGIIDRMENRLGIKVSLGNPFVGMTLGPEIEEQELKALAPRLMVATGLALRSFDA